jgi:hypothetical protein
MAAGLVLPYVKLDKHEVLDLAGCGIKLYPLVVCVSGR